MTSVTSTGVSGSASSQAFRLALLVKLFQTNGNSKGSDKSRPNEAAPPSQPPLIHPSRANSSAGLASMYEALQAPNNSSVSDLLSRMLEAVDSDGDGTISADELHAVTELTTVPKAGPTANAMVQKEGAASVLAGQIGHTGAKAGTDVRFEPADTTMEPKDATVRTVFDQTMSAASAAAPARTSFEALFQAMSLMLPQAKEMPGMTGSQRYGNLLKYLANAA